MFNKKKFAEILIKINETYDTMTEFAEKSGVNRTYLSQYINQKLDSPPSPKVLMKIANNSHNITNYEYLMQICGFLIDEKSGKLNDIRKAQQILKYENMIKKINLSNSEKEILNQLILYFNDNYDNNLSIEENKNNTLSIINNFKNIKNCDVLKIEDGFKLYIVAKCVNILIDKIYEDQSEIDSKYNYIELVKQLDALSKDLNIENSSKIFSIPILGKITAGQPILVEENIEGYLPVDPNIYGVTTSDDLFYLRVSGESMNLKVKNGDYALIRKQDYAEDGDIIVAIVNGNDEATLKRYKKINDEIVMLEPMSTYPMEPIIINLKETNFKIIGKAIGYFGKF